MVALSKRLKGDTYGFYNDGANKCTVGIGHVFLSTITFDYNEEYS
jgi:GH24 family phage-related lysozyme (muramidase)